MLLNSLPSGGITIRIACGRTTCRIAWCRRMPSDSAASVWPRSTESIAARMISAM